MNDRRYSRIGRIGFLTLAWVFAVSVLLQVLFAGLSLFVDSDNWTIHEGFARFIAVVPLLMLVFEKGGGIYGERAAGSPNAPGSGFVFENSAKNSVK